MKKLKFYALSSMLICSAIATAQTEETYDLLVNSVASPSAGVLTKQPVKLILRNAGATTVKAFTVGVIKNDAKLFEEHFDGQEILKNKTLELTLDGKVDVAYGEKAKFKVYAKVDGKDTNETNDTATVDMAMPVLRDYPYTWDPDSATVIGDFTFGKWKYDAEKERFYYEGRGNNSNSLRTPVIDFVENSNVSCNFKYYVSTKATLLVIVDYGETNDTIYSQQYDALNEGTYADIQASFKPKGRGRIIIRTTWGALTTAEAYVKDVNIVDAVPDVKTDKILSPMIERLATTSDGYKVKVRYVNVSPFDIANPKFCYSIGGKTVEETYDGTLSSNKSVDFLFGTPVDASQSGTSELVAWCEAEGDKVTDNDTIRTEFTFYDALDFPYVTTFDDGMDNWQAIDADADGHTWTFDSLDTTGGCGLYGQVSNNASEDYLLTPAIKMPAGQSRISFYCSGYLTSGTEHLTVLMGKHPEPAEMDTVLFDGDVNVKGWLNGYFPIKLNEAGTYYFAFKATGSGNRIYLDNLYIDRNEDLCMNDITFDTESGFGKTTANVTLSYINHGTTAQKDIVVRYYVNEVQMDEQTVTMSVEPGDTIYYVFPKPADISFTDSTYLLKGEIVTAVGPDQNNDVIYGQSLSNWPVFGVPYSNDFNDTARGSYWLAKSDTDGQASKWTVFSAGVNAYSQKYALRHNGKVAEGTKDWVFSECINMPRGSYDVSFFYRTNPNQAKDAYKQNFSLNLGNNRTPDAMTTQIVSMDGVLVSEPFYKKFTGTINVTDDGNYYLGFCFSTTDCNPSAYLLIDDLEIIPTSEGAELPYTADFSDGWTKYNTKTTNPYWTEYVENDSTTVERVARTNNHATMSYGFEDKFVSPKLRLDAGKTVNVTVSYALSSDSTNTALNMFCGHIDNPDSLELVASMPVVADSAYVDYTYSFVSTEADSCFFIGFRTNSPTVGHAGYVYDARIKTLSVKYDEGTSIASVSDNADLAICKRGNSVYISATASINSVEICDMSGCYVMSASSDLNTLKLDCTGLHGAYIIKAKTSQGEAVRKLVF